MSDSENHVDNTDDLDTFENEFFQRPEAPKEADADQKEEVKVGDTKEVTETELETDEDDAPKGEEVEEEELEEAPKPKAKKSAKERIDELTAEKYELRREIETLRREFEASKPRQEEKVKEPVKADTPTSAPNPDAVKEDGTPIYELGEFDPLFIRDLTKFTIAEETRAAKEVEERLAVQKQAEAAQQEISAKWNEKLEAAEKEIPEIRENIAQLADVFKDVEPGYGEYLASVIMNSDFGPEIMNHLSQNIGEAQKIVASGPAAATLSIGRLEARFIKADEETPQPKKTVSKATNPPETRTRGAHGRFAVQHDTDDLDAFEREFYQRR
jgi:hypothetical protein